MGKGDINNISIAKIEPAEKKLDIDIPNIGYISVDDGFTIDNLLLPLVAFSLEFEGREFLKDLLRDIGEYIIQNLDKMRECKIGYNIMEAGYGAMTMRFTGNDSMIIDFVKTKFLS